MCFYFAYVYLNQDIQNLVMKTYEAIRLINITKYYNNNIILDNISLNIGQRERIVIFGASGCGKTTILRLIAGFLAPDKGKLFIEEKLVSKEKCIIEPPEKRNIGMVFQDLALWPHLSVKGNIEFGLKVKGIPKKEREEKIKKILLLMNMSDYAEKKPHELSGGQQQRVALARTIVTEPNIILMDEPLSNLDIGLNMHLRQEILSLHKKIGFTMIYVTHNQDEAKDIATKIIFLHKGHIIDILNIKS